MKTPVAVRCVLWSVRGGEQTGADDAAAALPYDASS